MSKTVQTFQNDVALSSERRRLPLTTIWQITKLTLALMLVGFILSRTNWKAVTTIWGQISLPWLIMSTAAYGGTLLIQACRSWTLLDGVVPLDDLLEATLIKTVVSNTIADSAAMVSYLAVLRQRHRIPIGSGLVSVLGARLADAMVLGLVLIVAAAYMWKEIIVLHVAITILGIGVLVVWMLLIAVLLFRPQVVSTLYLLGRFSGLDGFSFFRRIKIPLTALLNADSRHLQRRTLHVLSYTTLRQGLYIAFTYCNMRLFHVHIGILPLVLIVSFSQLLSLVPIQVFGGLGVYDVTLMYLYSLFGLGHAVIVPVLIGLRVIFYAYNPLLLLYVPWHRRRRGVATFAPAPHALAQERL